MFESENNSDDALFPETLDMQGNRIVLALVPEKYAPQLQRIRFDDKMAEWDYGVVTCTVSPSETEKIGEIQFDQLEVVASRLLGGLDSTKKASEVTLMTFDELSGIGIWFYFMNPKVLRIIMLNPLFYSGISGKLSRIEIPTYILFSGGADRTIASSSRKFHDLTSGSTLHNIPGIDRGEILAKKTQFFSYLKSILVDDQQGS